MPAEPGTAGPMPSVTNRSTLPRAFSVLAGLTTAAVFLQAVTAGFFVNQDGRDSWVTVHGIIADVTWVLALVTAIVAFRRLRRLQPTLWRLSAALFVLALAQTGIGHLISDEGMDALIVVHVPLALVVFGLAGWLALVVARGGPIAAEPYGDMGAQRQKVSRSLT